MAPVGRAKVGEEQVASDCAVDARELCLGLRRQLCRLLAPLVHTVHLRRHAGPPGSVVTVLLLLGRDLRQLPRQRP